MHNTHISILEFFGIICGKALRVYFIVIIIVIINVIIVHAEIMVTL